MFNVFNEENISIYQDLKNLIQTNTMDLKTKNVVVNGKNNEIAKEKNPKVPFYFHNNINENQQVDFFIDLKKTKKVDKIGIKMKNEANITTEYDF